MTFEYTIFMSLSSTEFPIEQPDSSFFLSGRSSETGFSNRVHENSAHGSE